MASMNIRTGTVLGGALAALGAALALGLNGPDAVAQPAAPTLTLMTPPACTCSEPVTVAGSLLQNCTCGALQCVVAGNKAPVAPALTCMK